MVISTIIEYNHRAKYEYGICGACYEGHLDVAKWLMNNIEDLDIKVDNDYCMVKAVDEGYHHIISWIMKIEPDRYIIEYSEDGMEIIKFEINKNNNR